MSAALSIFSFFSYLALVLLVAIPAGQWRHRTASDFGTPGGIAALLCALCATLFVPWSGVAVLPLQTWVFYPLFALSLLINARRSRLNLRAVLLFLLVLALFVLMTDRFLFSVGLPGDRGSIESAGMILRLESIRSAKLIIAMSLFFVSLFFSFVDAYRDDASGNVAAFAFASLLVLVFLPVATAQLMKIPPPVSVVLDFFLSFVTAIAFGRGIRFLAARRRVRSETRSVGFFMLYAATSLLGGFLLLTSL